MQKLTVESIRQLFPAAIVRRYKKNQIVCYQGDRPSNIYFVLSGHIRYYDIDDDGNEKILHINGPQNIFPMLYAFGISEEINAFYATIDEAELLAIPLSDFKKVAESDIKFANSLTRWFLTEIEQLSYRINSFEKTDARNKILFALKYLATNYGSSTNGWQKLGFPVTQQFIADFTGLARETVSTTMGELERDKVIKTGKQKIIEISRKELAAIN